MAAHAMALVEVEITKHIKISVNSIWYENLFWIKTAELDIETVMALGLIIWKKYISINENFLEFPPSEKDEEKNILKDKYTKKQVATVLTIAAIAGNDWYICPIPNRQRVKIERKPKNTPIINGIVFLNP